MSLESVGQFVRNTRKQLKWTQEQLAEKSGVDPAYIRRLEAGKQLGSAFSLIGIAKALAVRPGILMDLLGDVPIAEDGADISDPELRVWLTPENLNKLSRVSRKAIIAIIRAEVEDQTPLKNTMLAAFVHLFESNGQDSSDESPKGEIKQLNNFPIEIAQLLDEVTVRDYSHFTNNPSVTEYRRDYVPGEFWPNLEDTKPDQVKVLVIKHPEYDLLIRAAIITSVQGQVQPPVLRVAYTKDTFLALGESQDKIREVVDKLIDNYLKNKPELFGLPT